MFLGAGKAAQVGQPTMELVAVHTLVAVRGDQRHTLRREPGHQIGQCVPSRRVRTMHVVDHDHARTAGDGPAQQCIDDSDQS